MTESEIVPISDDGDAILVVQKQPPEKHTRLRVDSRILRASSKVFEAIFGPYIAEGQQLDRQHPPKIFLRDDPNSIKIICQVLHFRNNNLPDTLVAHDVLTLSQTVVKYRLQEAMKLAMRIWLTPTSITQDLFVLLEASILLRDEPKFEAITRMLIWDCDEHFFRNCIDISANNPLWKICKQPPNCTKAGPLTV